MKIAYCSDIHMDMRYPFTDNWREFDVDADVLVIAGDLAEERSYKFLEDFFDFVQEKFSHVVMVAGNHEFYKADIKTRFFKNFFENYKNIHFLERESIEIDGVLFIGTTLWTDMGGRDPLVMFEADVVMSDYRLIKNDKNRLRPIDTVEIHDIDVNYIFDRIDKADQKTVVVVTHHAPCFKSISREYIEEDTINHCYFSELSQRILGCSPEKRIHWFHGHIHDKTEYEVSPHCKVYLNAFGYYDQTLEKRVRVVEI